MAELEKKEWVDWQPTKIVQKIAIQDAEGNILLLKRTESDHARAGKWDLPGGNPDKNDVLRAAEEKKEPHKVALLREVKEETGIELNESSIIGVWISSGVKQTQAEGPIPVLGLGYTSRMQEIRPQITLDHEHTEYKWVTREEGSASDFGEDGGLHSSIIQKV